MNKMIPNIGINIRRFLERNKRHGDSSVSIDCLEKRDEVALDVGGGSGGGGSVVRSLW